MRNIEVISEVETIQTIIQGQSIARFGDGELELIFSGGLRYIKQSLLNQKPAVFGNGGIWFSYQLKRILQSNDKNLLIGIPNIFYQGAEKKWKNRYFQKNKTRIAKLLTPGRIYYSAFFTRYNRLDPGYETHWHRISKIWEGKKIAIIGNDSTTPSHPLYKNAKQVAFIYCRKENVWNYGWGYRKLLKDCLSTNCELYLPIAGPVATLLAYDLNKNGKQCVDLGQVTTLFDKHKGTL